MRSWCSAAAVLLASAGVVHGGLSEDDHAHRGGLVDRRLSAKSPWRVESANLCDKSTEQHEYGECPDIPAECTKCEPVDCEYSDWTNWRSAGYCTGLCERDRMIKTHANECGDICSDVTRETKECLQDSDWADCQVTPVDCAWNVWSEWSMCTSTTVGQTFRTRTIKVQARNGGKACNGEAGQTAPCGKYMPVDCELSQWDPWSPCSVSCGGGRQSRMRRSLHHAENSGKPCEGTLWESRVCGSDSCYHYQDCMVGDWSDWKGCTPKQPEQRFRERQVVQKAMGGGMQCSDALEETLGCEEEPTPVDCVLTEWSKWEDCSRTCNGGQQIKVRHVAEGPKHGGSCSQADLRHIRSCSTQPCPGPKPEGKTCDIPEWAEWSDCSEQCGEGVQYRERERMDRACPQQGGLKEVRGCKSADCPVSDCHWGSWEGWSACTTSCGGGTKRRDRVVKVPPRDGGKLCDAESKSELAACNTQSCGKCVDGLWGEWTAWLACSTTCGQGFRSRQRYITQHPNKCGKPALGESDEYEVCESDPCVPDEDCKLSEWGQWSSCSNSCFGQRERQRSIKQFVSGNGKPCINESLKDIEPCNPVDGALAPVECNSEAKPCELDSWQEWSDCPATCGGGQIMRKRKVIKAGSPCGDTVETKECGTQLCEAKCVDCVWGQWSEWGDCTKCGGQRWRQRGILQLPNFCGHPCHEGRGKEVSNCSSTCGEERWCAWSPWSAFNSCSGKCGATQTRQRSLGVSTTKPLGGAMAFLFKASEDITCAGTQLDVVSCAAVNDHLVMNLTTVSSNNLVGQGPNENDPPNIRYTMVGTADGHYLDLVIEADENSVKEYTNGQIYHPDRASRNGLDFNNFGVINVRGGTKANLKAKFVKTGTDKPVVVEKFYITFYDLDQPDSFTKEKLTVKGYDLYYLSSDTEVKYTSIEGGGTFTSSQIGTSQDNPTRPMQLTAKQKARAVTFVFEGVADFTFALEVTAEHGQQLGRSFMFAGVRPGDGPEKCKDECVPKPCVWGAWSEWHEPTCLGLCERHREIHSHNNECGPPCEGPAISTKKCVAKCFEKRDCAFDEWGEWSHCPEGAVQRFRKRKVLDFPENGGKDCEGLLEEVGQCGDPETPSVPCEVSDWSAWQECSHTCGGGFSTRHRFLVSPAHWGGEPCDTTALEELRPCGEESCHDTVDCELHEWTPWSECEDGQMLRTRGIKRDAVHGGDVCSSPLREIRGCEKVPVDCEMSEWSIFQECSSTCGQGQQRLHRRIVRYPANGGNQCPESLMKTEPCEIKPCEARADCTVGPWSSWESCSSTCDTGSQARSREIVAMPRGGGKACEMTLLQVTECKGLLPCEDVNCAMGDWEDWGPCLKSCGAGDRLRSRRPVHPAKPGGKPCKVSDLEEYEPCNTQPCDAPTCIDGKWKEWSEWSTCSHPCGGGLMERTRQYSSASAACGQPVTGPDQETKGCNDVPCLKSQDCTFGTWKPWTDCTPYSARSCHGYQKRSRQITSLKQGDGAYCEGPIEEKLPCKYRDTCPKPGEKVDCVFAEWKPWSSCSVTCGGGQQSRKRVISVEPQNEGVGCMGPTSETQSCGKVICVGMMTPIDCTYDEWSEWSKCKDCNSQRFRSRKIAKKPEWGGKACDLAPVREIGSCDSACDKELWCEWSEWLEWGSCSRTCGPGKRSRRRHLELADAPPPPPAPPIEDTAELWDSKEALERRAAELARSLKTHRIQELSLAFGCGCLSFVALLASARFCRRSVVRVEEGVVGYQELQSARTALTGSRAADPEGEVE